MFRLFRTIPLFRLVAIAKAALLLRSHVLRLNRRDRARLGELARRGPRMSGDERSELIRLLGKLEPRILAFAAAEAFSPLRPPRWLAPRQR